MYKENKTLYISFKETTANKSLDIQKNTLKNKNHQREHKCNNRKLDYSSRLGGTKNVSTNERSIKRNRGFTTDTDGSAHS